MAQLVERYVRNVQATSSNLVISTKNRNRTFCLGCGFLFCLFMPYSNTLIPYVFILSIDKYSKACYDIFEIEKGGVK